jgi:glycosyltransferase involved in cell wall biosynthesis
MPGACQAEWVDDRMFAYLNKGYNISLISASCCFKHTDSRIKHIRIPALSPHGADYEYKEIKRRNISLGKNVWLTFAYLKPMSLLAGLMEKLKLKSGEGRWSWFVSSALASLSFKIREAEYIYSTGGPASAHLTGILLAKLCGKRVICEFQDPLSGKDIGRNKLSQKGLRFFENFIIKRADRVIYCTENAMLFAKEQYSKYADKIDFVYPGSNPINNNTAKSVDRKASQEKINITYLGSLYQTRNMDSMMKAIDELSLKRPDILNKLEINIYGNMNPDIKLRIQNFKHEGLLKIHGLVTRSEALQRAAEADVLLLIQNTDDRSITTIPFKTYDYLHTGQLVLGLIYRNDELEKILKTHGHITCQADNIEEIKELLENIADNYTSYVGHIKVSELTPELSVKKMQQIMKVNA